jgi:hypothetical protein
VIEKKDCLWSNKGYCKWESCVKDCDLETLEYNRTAIYNRIEEELHNVKKMAITMSQRKKDVIIDKIMGMTVMFKMLKKEFGEDIDSRIKEIFSNPAVRFLIRKYTGKEALDVMKSGVLEDKRR